jgi:PAS domain S-box-containing protein
MSSGSTSRANVPLEDSIPEAGASLESILCTEELQRRPSRPTDYEKENCALVALMSVLADSPSTIFQKVAETILDITQCDSAGLSLLTSDGKRPDVCGKRFYWPAIAGMWNPHVGGGTPRNFGPCGDVLDQNRTLLFRHFERRYPYLMPVIPAAEECLLVPFYVDGKAVGTIWAIMHSDRRKFDAEDNRLMASLGKFVSSAYQALRHIEDLKFQVFERERAEAEVRELAKGLEAKIRRLVEANVVGIVLWNLEGAITGANDAFLRMVQYEREDLASGRVRWTDLTPAEWRDRDERRITELKTTGIFQPFEKEYFRKDGSRVPVLLGGALFEGSANEGVAFILDLSEQKRAQEKLQQTQRSLYATQLELAQVSRLTTMGELAASIAHEVKQPIGAAVTNAQACLRFLNRDQPDVPEAREAALEMVRDGTRAAAIIDGVRSLYRKGFSKLGMVDVNEVIREMVVMLHDAANRYSVRVHTKLDETAPEVMVDRVQLQQVLMNIMLNGIEAMRDTTGELSIKSEVAEDGQLLISVSDTGVGLPAGKADEIFNPFFTTNPQGTGLGLAITRSIVESHGGRVWATANSGQGATFQFTLPQTTAARA